MIDFEKSCGAVIYTELNGMRLYLIEQMQKGHRSTSAKAIWRKMSLSIRRLRGRFWRKRV